MSAIASSETIRAPNHGQPIALRRVLGQFATGVTIITTVGPDGSPVGLTVNSFSSVSLAPPLVAWCLRREAISYDLFVNAPHWAISVLAADQLALARRFCSPITDRFAGVPVITGMTGVPLLEGAIAHLECTAFKGVDGGDHRIFLGRVEHHDMREGAPLLFHAGDFGDWAPRPRPPRDVS